MGLTVSGLSSLYYNTYALKSSDTYKNNAVDSSTVSQNEYNVPDIAAAFDSLDTESDFSSIGSISSYAREVYRLSQIQSKATLDSKSSSILNLLSGDTDLYGVLGSVSAENSVKLATALSENSSSTDHTESVSDAISTYANTLSSYNKYLESTEDSSVNLLI